MDEPVIGRIVKPLAQLERALEPACEKAPADLAGGIAIKHAGGDQGVRVEHRDAERAPIRPAQGDEGAGRQRLRRRIHHDFVRVDPRVAALGAAMEAGQQGDLRPARRVVGLAGARRLRDCRGIRHDSPAPNGIVVPATPLMRYPYQPYHSNARARQLTVARPAGSVRASADSSVAFFSLYWERPVREFRAPARWALGIGMFASHV